jgi:hypothetical protein
MSIYDIKGKPARMILPDGVIADRRNHQRRDALVLRIAAEYREMPGLTLTVKQTSRLLGVDQAACTRILTLLMRTGALRCTAAGQYVRADRTVDRAS